MNDFVDFGAGDVGDAFTISMWVNLRTADNIKTLVANSTSGAGPDGFRSFHSVGEEETAPP